MTMPRATPVIRLIAVHTATVIESPTAPAGDSISATAAAGAATVSGAIVMPSRA